MLSIIFLPALLSCTYAAETILGVYIFSRHGDRTPKSIPPANLTSLGYRQVFTSGTHFRNRYIASNASSQIAGINSDIVKHSQITASAPRDTVLITSAQAFLQGLYPPVGSTLESDTLRDGRTIEPPMDGYQLIPIETVSRGTGSEDSTWLQGASDCTQAKISSNEYFSSSDYRNMLASTKDFYERLTPLVNGILGSEEINYENAYGIYDILNVAAIHNASLTETPLFTDATLSELRTLADHLEFNLAYNASSPIRAIAGSILAGHIEQTLTKTIESKGKSKISIEFGAYASFLSFFGLAGLTTLRDTNDSFLGVPDYASTMTFELFTTADASSFPAVEDLQVRFLFHNGTTSADSTPVPYPLFGQPATELSWTDFQTGMNRFAVTGQEQWCQACGNSAGVCAKASSSTSDAGTSPMGSEGGISKAVAGVIGAMVTLAIVLTVEAAVLLIAGLRVVRKNRLDGQSEETEGIAASSNEKVI